METKKKLMYVLIVALVLMLVGIGFARVVAWAVHFEYGFYVLMFGLCLVVSSVMIFGKK